KIAASLGKEIEHRPPCLPLAAGGWPAIQLDRLFNRSPGRDPLSAARAFFPLKLGNTHSVDQSSGSCISAMPFAQCGLRRIGREARGPGMAACEQEKRAPRGAPVIVDRTKIELRATTPRRRDSSSDAS